MVEVSCLDCLARVRARKQSEFHTTIEWSHDGVDACTELSRARADGTYRRVQTCSRLQASIAAAVREGTLEIGGTVD